MTAEMEYDPFVRVVSMSAEAACDFLGVPRLTRVEDGGPPAEPSRWKLGARVWHVYMGEQHDENAARLNIQPIREVGASRTGELLCSYAEIVALLGEPNVTDLDDDRKVKASWGFIETGRKGFVWCYRFDGELQDCTWWSTAGDVSLLREIFGAKWRGEEI